jgi:nuclear pore complex protein Nup205
VFQADLDEVEPSLEEYPMALAFLDLIDSLTNFPIPPSIGRGYQRQSGFEMYLDFIRDTIFYKFLTRAYKDPGQKVHYLLYRLSFFLALVIQFQVLYLCCNPSIDIEQICVLLSGRLVQLY